MFSTLFQTLNTLPVTEIANNVAEHFAARMIPVVTSDVASGKTMLIPAHCAEILKDDVVDNVIYVLEPTRFLANNAAESLRSILGKESENLVGCINSNRSDDESVLHPNNRIIFTTVGYALSSGILSRRHNFILDEAHETSIDLSLTKAYLHHRLQLGDLINVAVLSATIDITNELQYWGDDAVHFTTKGSAFPVEFFHRPAQRLADSVMELIHDYHRTGILVFVSGVEEIEEAIKEISTTASMSSVDFEIYGIHGNSSGEQRRLASHPRQNQVKILVGTNVLESGVSLPWVNGGVSSGDTKVMHVSGNVRKLNKEELPRWRIRQQTGRVARFEPGVFILSHPAPLETRPEMSAPDIVRLPLTELVMHCTAFPDIHIHSLNFTKREQPQPGAISQAIATLVEYGLIEECDDGRVTLTEEGRMIQPLPLSYRAAVAYCEAVRLGKVSELLPLVAMLDIGDMRHIHRDHMHGGVCNFSDPVQQLMTVAQFYYTTMDMNRPQTRDEAEFHNISLKKYQEYTLLLRDLEKKTNTRASLTCYLPNDNEEARNRVKEMTKQVIFRSMILESYPFASFLGRVVIPNTNHHGAVFNNASLSNTTSCHSSPLDKTLFCSGNVRVITPKQGMPFAVLESLTMFTKSDMKNLIARFGKKTFERIAGISQRPTALSEWLVGIKTAETVASLNDDMNFDDDPYLERLYRSSYTNRTDRPHSKFSDSKPLEPAIPAAAVRTGSLGDILSAAMKKNKN